MCEYEYEYEHKNEKQDLPAIGHLLNQKIIRELIEKFGRDQVVNITRKVVSSLREDLDKNGKDIDSAESKEKIKLENIYSQIVDQTRKSYAPSIIKIHNATGIILHTNIGRAPLGENTLRELQLRASGYVNLEFDLTEGSAGRGDRQQHLKKYFKNIVGAEDVLVVNNTAAALILILKSLSHAESAEVIVSRGELIEIGGSFRLPDIMSSSGIKMVEVGTTNKTRLSDFERAITANTKILFKAHTSNYTIKGFTESVLIADLVALAKKKNLITVYDVGSGLLRIPKALENIFKQANVYEPIIKEIVECGVDLITFSGDKLLGGPQAGIILGKQALIEKLANEPLMRAIRPGKLDLICLEIVLAQYLNDSWQLKNNPVFKILSKTKDQLLEEAEMLSLLLKINSTIAIVPHDGQVGGGALPELKLPGYAVTLDLKLGLNSSLNEEIYRALLMSPTPVLGILKSGKLIIDPRALEEGTIPEVAKIISQTIANIVKNYEKK
ncbi:MAG: L-seryl-tRNA(Sec) selenium transferase [Oligoflexia bacterium]|nr:L-seryl-tRNA(Sec) selenium transferase [Oligoflexia bacterium]